jgi:hypothetical protein
MRSLIKIKEEQRRVNWMMNRSPCQWIGASAVLKRKPRWLSPENVFPTGHDFNIRY